MQGGTGDGRGVEPWRGVGYLRVMEAVGGADGRSAVRLPQSALTLGFELFRHALHVSQRPVHYEYDGNPRRDEVEKNKTRNTSMLMPEEILRSTKNPANTAMAMPRATNNTYKTSAFIALTYPRATAAWTEA